MNYNENTYTSIKCGLLLSMYMDSTCYTILYNDNSIMYHAPRHKLYYTDNTIIIELKSIYATLETKYFGDVCCKTSINVSTCNINMSILTSIHIISTWYLHDCL